MMTNGIQNKDKVKKGYLPEDMLSENRYLAAQTVPDFWICYPWEATWVLAFILNTTMGICANFSTSDIDQHDELAKTNTIK